MKKYPLVMFTTLVPLSTLSLYFIYYSPQVRRMRSSYRTYLESTEGSLIVHFVIGQSDKEQKTRIHPSTAPFSFRNCMIILAARRHVRSFDPRMNLASVVMAQEGNSNSMLGNAVIISRRNATFIRRW